jgi:hypothetical protein
VNVAKLIASAKQGAGRRNLEGKALRDLRAVIKANDAEPNRAKHVSMHVFLKHLQENYGVSGSSKWLLEACRRQLGRGWSK